MLLTVLHCSKCGHRFLQIAQLFVSPIGGDGRPVFESYTGAYAVKITIGGKWQVCSDAVDTDYQHHFLRSPSARKKDA